MRQLGKAYHIDEFVWRMRKCGHLARAFVIRKSKSKTKLNAMQESNLTNNGALPSLKMPSVAVVYATGCCTIRKLVVW